MALLFNEPIFFHWLFSYYIAFGCVRRFIDWFIHVYRMVVTIWPSIVPLTNCVIISFIYFLGFL